MVMAFDYVELKFGTTDCSHMYVIDILERKDDKRFDRFHNCRNVERSACRRKTSIDETNNNKFDE